MPPTTTSELQAQVHLLAVVVSCVLAELPEGAASRVRTALENVLRAQAPLPEDIDAATARLASMVVAPVPLIAGRRARPGAAGQRATGQHFQETSDRRIDAFFAAGAK